MPTYSVFDEDGWVPFNPFLHPAAEKLDDRVASKLFSHTWEGLWRTWMVRGEVGLDNNDLWDAEYALSTDRVVVTRPPFPSAPPFDELIFDPDPSSEDLTLDQWRHVLTTTYEPEVPDEPDDDNPWTVLGPAPLLTDQHPSLWWDPRWTFPYTDGESEPP